jgi:ATP-binding cassette subfamily C (CFTR/MRP) protein 4
LPPPGWPAFGEIEFKEMSLWYEKDEPPVISNLNVKIKSGEKVRY